MKTKQRANKRLAKVTATKILNKYDLLESAEIPFTDVLGAENVHYQERKLKGCLGNMVRSKSTGVITVSNEMNYEPQKRFVIAHEFGHWLLHKDVPNFNCDDSMLHLWHGSGSKYEIEANAFASELLMPEIPFAAKCQGREFSSELILELANAFRTSLTATAFRFTDIGQEPMMVVFSKNKFARWNKSSHDFAFGFFERKFPIPKNSLTYSFYEGKVNTPDGRVTIAQTWFTKDWAVKDDQYLNEAIIPLPKINGCLTFLWQHELNFQEF